MDKESPLIKKAIENARIKYQHPTTPQGEREVARLFLEKWGETVSSRDSEERRPPADNSIMRQPEQTEDAWGAWFWTVIKRQN